MANGQDRNNTRRGGVSAPRAVSGQMVPLLFGVGVVALGAFFLLKGAGGVGLKAVGDPVIQ